MNQTSTQPQARKASVLCPYHPTHDRILKDHDKAIDDFQSTLSDLRKNSSQSRAEIYNEIKTVERSKVSTNLFYLFISVYSVLYILGIISVYRGMHQNSLTFQSGITDVKVMQAELKAGLSSADQRIQSVTDDIKDLRNEVKSLTKRGF